MALPHACWVGVCVFFSFFFFFVSDLSGAAVTAAGSNRGGFSVKLFHRDSPLSPLHDPSLTPRGRAERDLRLSKARAEYFTSSASKQSTLVGRGRRERSEVSSIGGNYLMSYSLGTPPVKLVGILDTGSDLTWTQCKPCLSCFTQDDPLFDPAASSSYGLLTCDSPDCKQISTCTGSGVCEYTYSYAFSFTRGTFATDTLTLESDDGAGGLSRRVRFGCANNNSAHFDRRMDGIVGLGGGPLSVVRQLGFHWFAYCMVPFEDSTSAGTITFGGRGGGALQAVDGAVSTPLFNEPHDETFYTLNLNRIGVGNGVQIELPAEDRDIIVDTGTPHILLNTTVHDRLVAAYAAAAAGIPSVQDDPSGFKLCYEAQYGSRLPDVTFGFTGADLRLGAEKNLLVRVSDGRVCLGVVVNEGISIFGAVATQNFKVGIDLLRRRVTFAPADCTKTN